MTDRLTTASRGQSGYALPWVLGVLVVFILIASAVLAFVFAGSRMTRASIDHSHDIRAIDGALETALQRVRNESGLCNGTPFVVDQQGYDVSCDAEDVQAPPTGPEDGQTVEQRTVSLLAEDANGLQGRALVRIVDIVVLSVDPADPSGPSLRDAREGFAVEVCDWLLGREQAGGSLRGCST